MKTLTLAWTCLLLGIPCSAATIVVDPNGSADYTTIQAAIDDANDYDEIEVWPGTYHEAIDFKGKPVRLYSSGGPDVTTIDANGGYHVVQCVNGEDANTILEGLTITGGNANGAGADSGGGGMYNNGSRATVKNCTFSGNSASSSGGGMYSFGGGCGVSNCRFSGNTSGFMGGGMYNFGSDITVTDCTFTGNEAIELGGGMANSAGSPIVTDCEFSGNKAGIKLGYGFGGGIYNNGTLTLVRCYFIGNVAEGSTAVTGGGLGGGVYNTGSAVNIRDCRFSANYGEEGGGMYNSGSSPAISGCSFTGNLTTQYHGGGGMQNVSSSPTVDNCTFSGNGGSIGWSPDAGAMLNQASSNPAVSGCTFIGNRGFFVGGIYNDSSNPTVTNCTFIANVGEFWFAGAIDGGNPVVTNCILWGNTPIKGVSSTAVVSYSDVEGGYSGTGNIDADPLFVDVDGPDDIAGTEDDNLRLLPGSACIDAGDSNSVPPDLADLDADGNVTEPVPFDIDGLPRLYDDPNTIDTGTGTLPIVDMGAHEFIPCDFEPDGDIDEVDFIMFILYWLDTGCGRCGGADLTGEGKVDLADFAEFASLWQEGV